MSGRYSTNEAHEATPYRCLATFTWTLQPASNGFALQIQWARLKDNRLDEVVEQGTSYTKTVELDEDLEQLLYSLKDQDQVGHSSECVNMPWDITEGSH